MNEVVLSLYRGAIPRPITMKSILADVAEQYGVDADALRLTQTRKKYIARPRQDFMWRCRQVKFADGSQRYSLPQIGMFLGGMHHTTVLWGARAHEARLGAQATNSRVEDRLCRTVLASEAA